MSSPSTLFSEKPALHRKILVATNDATPCVMTPHEKARLDLATNFSIEANDLGFSPFLGAPKPCEGGAQRGGLGKAHQLFGAELPLLLEEPNLAPVA
jgi:hypothetical protein